MPSLSRCVTRAAHYVTAREKKWLKKIMIKIPEQPLEKLNVNSKVKVRTPILETDEIAAIASEFVQENNNLKAPTSGFFH